MGCYLIAEVGQAHDGSLGIAHSFIDALVGSGVNAIKFQTHIAEAESSTHEPFRTRFSYEDDTRYDYWKRMEFTLEQWRGIKTHCDKAGLDFISSPFSNAAVDLLEEVGVAKYKIGSGEVSNFLMLEKIARTGKEIILSSGMSDLAELDSAVNFLRPFGNKLTVLQCCTSYPTKAEDVGLRVMDVLQKRYDVPVGLSDHSGVIYPCLAAAALGASVLEFHITFDKRMFGPDSTSSLCVDDVRRLAEGVRFIEAAMGQGTEKADSSKFEALRKVFGKSLAVNQDMRAGSILSFDDLEAKKPAGHGIPAKEYQRVVGKRLNRNLDRWSFLQEGDVSD
ncbi:N-acetylneuraminate synthase [Pararhizobium polonicum]|uniref:N-acetylneuraminate synthase n=1 Tax=Pararhizobium polonicum TaxID=1612624 RepID=A0A1C7NU75_9HYPH|nr:N-acetylneuraminate synthase family protein [Pararhizobium polonicum]OBZ92236.1 N-acetylneuraminate synthase [Pararhizobium polonicum]